MGDGGKFRSPIWGDGESGMMGIELLLAAHREQDARDVVVSIVSQWPLEVQLEWLRDSMKNSLAAMDNELAAVRKRLGESV